MLRHHRSAARGAGRHDHDGDLGQHRSAARGREHLGGVGAERQHPQQRPREQGRGGLADRAAGAVGELADRAGAHAEVGRDPLVAVAVDRVPDDHLALLGRQRADRSDHAAEALAGGDHLVGPLDAVEPLRELVQPGLRIARDVERRVVRDPVEPRPQRRRHPRVVVARQRRVGVDERLLHGVLGRRAGGDEATAVAQQRRSVALDDRRERLLVAGVRERDQPLVGRARQQPHPRTTLHLRSRHDGSYAAEPRAVRRGAGPSVGRPPRAVR